MERSWLFVRIEWVQVKSGEADAPEERTMGKDGHLTVLEEGIGTDVRAHGGADHHLALRGFCEPLTPWFSAISFASHSVWTCLGLFICR